MSKKEVRCIALTRKGWRCNRLLGIGTTKEFETKYPACGAVLLITEGGIRLVRNAVR